MISDILAEAVNDLDKYHEDAREDPFVSKVITLMEGVRILRDFSYMEGTNSPGALFLAELSRAIEAIDVAPIQKLIDEGVRRDRDRTLTTRG